jgi:glucosylceramidase
MGLFNTMDERKTALRNSVTGGLGIALVMLLTALAVYLPHPTRRARPVAVAAPQPLPLARPVLPSVQVWLSTADRKLRLARQPDVELTERKRLPDDVIIDTQATYQSMVGFGAAITDSSAWLIQNTMSRAQRQAFLQELFGPPPGLNFSMTRLTIGASDFSLQHYTLDDMPAGEVDPSLAHFNVTPNIHDVIPTVQEALAVNPNLRIIASPWSAPAWMKTSANLISGKLLEQFESVYANYLVKYVETYRGYGIPIFALTVQNEPAFEPATYPGMAMPAQTRARFIGQYLGPALASRAPKTIILDWDHNWDEPAQPMTVLADPDAARYVAGVAWHCYRGTPSSQSDVKRAYPGKDAYISECSGGDWASAKKGELLLFARDVLLAGIRHSARGVVYWNTVLDEHHGPHLGGCELCKGIVTIDSHTGAVSRNDEYYAFAHFSRFVLPGAVRVGSAETDRKLNNVAFQNPSDGSLVLVVVNSHLDARAISVKEAQTGFQYTMPPQSLATFVWDPNPAETWIRRALDWWKVQAKGKKK